MSPKFPVRTLVNRLWRAASFATLSVVLVMAVLVVTNALDEWLRAAWVPV